MAQLLGLTPARWELCACGSQVGTDSWNWGLQLSPPPRGAGAPFTHRLGMEGLGELGNRVRSTSYPFYELSLTGVLGPCDLGLTTSCHHLLGAVPPAPCCWTPPCTLSLFSNVLARINEQKNLFLCLICHRVVNNP